MIVELEWDSRLLGRKIGKLCAVPPEKSLRKLLLKSREDGFTYITSRLELNKISDIRLLERLGFYITDIGSVLEREIMPGVPSSEFRGPAFSMREATVKDTPRLKSMVKGLFTGSRFYNDPFFTKKDADKVYQAWIENSLNDKRQKIFLAEGSGFIACRKVTAKKGDIPLIGVVSSAQGKGVGSSLFGWALEWFRKSQVSKVATRTQVSNVKAMNFYSEAGFRIKYVDITMGYIVK